MVDGKDVTAQVSIICPCSIKHPSAAIRDGAKVGDKVVFNPRNASGDNLTELSSMLNIDKEVAANVQDNFEFTISSGV